MKTAPGATGAVETFRLIQCADTDYLLLFNPNTFKFMHLTACRSLYSLKGIRVGRKQLLVMNFMSFFLLVACLNVTAGVYSQKVTLSGDNIPLKQVFREIKKQTGYLFGYKETILQKAGKVNIHVTNASVQEVLELCFQNQPLTYSIFNDKVIIVKEKASPPVLTESAPVPPRVKITGKIYTDAGTPLAGANISEKGKGNTVFTKEDGSFQIMVEGDKAVLVITYVGYERKEILVGDQTEIIVKLSQAQLAMNDIVVIGYGTAKKVTLTGSVSTVDSKTFKDRGPVANPLQALQGQVPGVTVTRSSAQPGRESWSFLVRGVSSVNSTEPLVIVDGMPIPNLGALNSFNPADIDNISFLKDAAASIYGARAAGGVVLITTKRGKSGKTVIEYNGSLSQKKIGLQPKLLDVSSWGPFMQEARATDGYAPADQWYSLGSLAVYAKEHNLNWISKADATALGLGLDFKDVKDFAFFPGTMQDVLWGNAVSSEHQLSLAGRSDKNGYRLSLGYLNDGSLLQVGTNSNKRYNVRLANDIQLSPKFKLETNMSLEKNDIVQPSNIGAILNNGIQPGLPTSTMNGKAYVWGSGIGNASPNNIAEYGGLGKEYNTRISTNFNLTWNIAKNLKAVGTAGYFFHNADYRTQENLIPFYDYAETTLISSLTPGGAGRSFYQRASRREAYYNASGYLEYNTTFANDHDVRVMVGSQYERDETNTYLAKTLDVLSDVPASLTNSYGDLTSKSVSEGQNHYAIAGSFGRLNYAYKNKYLFEANSRYDGSSKFDADSRWKLFYGFSAGWRISQENFMRTVNFIDELKLRASWGNVGNQSGIGLYDYLQLLNLNSSIGPTSNNFPIIGTAPVVRIAPAGLVALDRSWEKVQTSNLGLDFAVLKNKLYGSFEYFVKKNDNMLLDRIYPAVLGTGAPKGNNGELKTWGWELSLNWRGQAGNVNYHIGGNISDNRNKLVNFGGQKVIGSNFRGFHGQGATNSANTAVEGYPFNSYFGLEYAGRIQTQKELDDYKLLATNSNVLPTGSTRIAGLQLGDNMFVDRNGDGKITFPEDAMYLGTDDPRLTYSFNGGLEWKGFDFNFIFQGVGKRTLIRDGNWRIPGQVLFQAQNAAFNNKWWTPDRTDAPLPRLSSSGTINNYNYFPSNWVAENGAYLRLKNLVIGYTLPQKISKLAHLQRLRVYFSGNDLWEITHIKDGWDPEAPRTVSNTGDANNNNQSTFSQRYPFYRYLTAGVNVTF